MFGVQKSSLNMFWETLPSLLTLVSDWLRAKSALLWMKKKEKEKWMMASILHLLWRKITYMLTCGRHSLVSGTQNDIAVS